MADCISFIGLDVQKESTVVAVASGGLRGEFREYGRIGNTETALDRLLRKFGGDGVTLRFAMRRGRAAMAFNFSAHGCAACAPPSAPAALGIPVAPGVRYGRPAITQLHRRWVADLIFEQPVRHLVLEDYIIEAAPQTPRDRLTARSRRC